jgi:hypothetical protein
MSKNPSQKRAGGVAQGVGPEFKPQYQKKKKEKKEHREGWKSGSSGNCQPRNNKKCHLPHPQHPQCNMFQNYCTVSAGNRAFPYPQGSLLSLFKFKQFSFHLQPLPPVLQPSALVLPYLLSFTLFV